VGLFTGLLTLPLAPVRGAAWVAEQVALEADRQLYDEDRIRAELLAVELEAEDGLIDPAEQLARQHDLFERLVEAQQRRERADG
jgi:hypothetical protein